MPRKYSYAVEVYIFDKWTALPGVGAAGRGFAEGYYYGRHDADTGPYLAMRVIRSDGKVIESRPACETVTIGAVAGFPTAEQFEAASVQALSRARQIRETHRGHK